MNTIYVQRYTSDDRPTLSHVLVAPAEGDETFMCFGLEDRFRVGPKVAGDTRIPAGVYRLAWRTVGRFAARFQRKGYKGAIELCNVPGFTAILIHAGNTKADTTGCLLVGMGANLAQRTISHSRDAVAKLYGLFSRHEGDWEIHVD